MFVAEQMGIKYAGRFSSSKEFRRFRDNVTWSQLYYGTRRV
jgi:hypothetical protein